ncbi:DUF2634 domain-containing protein [Lysinibacillus antri]|uniref:DUF2634 domain-containing protein n=1 Tax=Lysinibacillus antri TaxID=2498145 RepID=A0A3S0R8C3_9BACI|nr:DUF2634 domain-containing protein [Lysinibacillus antri]RUL56455.1 DUF2634 domain-containing protein [Lysinibacillus antri]
MKTLGLLNGDLRFENGDFVMIEGPEEIAQCIAISMGTNLKEWFLNEAFGMDHIKLLEKSSDGEARAEVIRILGQEPRIDEIVDIEINNNKNERIRTIKYTVRLIDGTTLSEEVPIGA